VLLCTDALQGCENMTTNKIKKQNHQYWNSAGEGVFCCYCCVVVLCCGVVVLCGWLFLFWLICFVLFWCCCCSWWLDKLLFFCFLAVDQFALFDATWCLSLVCFIGKGKFVNYPLQKSPISIPETLFHTFL